MNLINLPSGFKKEDQCNRCDGPTKIFEVFLSPDGVVTRFQCETCKSISGLIYSGSFVERYKKAEAAEQTGTPVVQSDTIQENIE